MDKESTSIKGLRRHKLRHEIHCNLAHLTFKKHVHDDQDDNIVQFWEHDNGDNTHENGITVKNVHVTPSKFNNLQEELLTQHKRLLRATGNTPLLISTSNSVSHGLAHLESSMYDLIHELVNRTSKLSLEFGKFPTNIVVSAARSSLKATVLMSLLLEGKFFKNLDIGTHWISECERISNDVLSVRYIIACLKCCFDVLQTDCDFCDDKRSSVYFIDTIVVCAFVLSHISNMSVRGANCYDLFKKHIHPLCRIDIDNICNLIIEATILTRITSAFDITFNDINSDIRLNESTPLVYIPPCKAKNLHIVCICDNTLLQELTPVDESRRHLFSVYHRFQSHKQCRCGRFNSKKDTIRLSSLVRNRLYDIVTGCNTIPMVVYSSVRLTQKQFVHSLEELDAVMQNVGEYIDNHSKSVDSSVWIIPSYFDNRICWLNVPMKLDVEYEDIDFNSCVKMALCICYDFAYNNHPVHNIGRVNWSFTSFVHASDATTFAAKLMFVMQHQKDGKEMRLLFAAWQSFIAVLYRIEHFRYISDHSRCLSSDMTILIVLHIIISLIEGCTGIEYTEVGKMIPDTDLGLFVCKTFKLYCNSLQQSYTYNSKSCFSNNILCELVY